ncbi:MAG: hypothetical protein Ta2A_26070 [Treponemataceae bacterium]|nr:MAG: hypothetical protein Ta2A_26070 [Treponemataceae bacterium]
MMHSETWGAKKFACSIRGCAPRKCVGFCCVGVAGFWRKLIPQSNFLAPAGLDNLAEVSTFDAGRGIFACFIRGCAPRGGVGLCCVGVAGFWRKLIAQSNFLAPAVLDNLAEVSTFDGGREVFACSIRGCAPRRGVGFFCVGVAGFWRKLIPQSNFLAPTFLYNPAEVSTFDAGREVWVSVCCLDVFVVKVRW